MNADFWEIHLRPQGEPTDAIKLAYQNEFGCGHILAEESVVAARVADELAQTAREDDAEPFEDIGNGLCRLNLHHADVRALSPVTVARMMAVTNVLVHGSSFAFQGKLNSLRQAVAERGCGLSLGELDAYLAAYRAKGCPAVSHSEQYRLSYRPAYRVVLRTYGEALPMLVQLERKLAQGGAALAVIDGDCGSGKTTLADRIAPLYRANVIHMDHFFLPFAMRSPERMSEAGGNIHYERFESELLRGLLSRKPFAYNEYDAHRDVSVLCEVQPSPVTLIEGSYSLHPRFEAAYAALDAVRVRLTVDPSEQLRRIRLRSGDVLLERFQNEWIPLEKRYFLAYHKERRDEIVFSCGKPESATSA